MPITSTTPVVTPQQFVADYPEFSDSAKYTVSSMNYWLAVATLLLNPNRFDANTLILATELYVAHNLVIEAQAQDTAKAGGWPGITKGVINSESAGAVTVSYDTAPVIEERAGHWNLTVYGLRFIRLAKLFGAGPIQVGPGFGAPGTVPGSDFGSAWSGPNCKPGWFG
jgi:hypothetical protein